MPPKWQGYLLALGISIIVVFQEKDSFDFKYALGPLIFNNIVFISANYLLDHPEDYNMDCVKYGSYWYAASGIGFLGMMSSWLNHYFLFDCWFVVCTCISLFYCWQMYTDETITLKELWYETIFIKQTILEYIRKKKQIREETMLRQTRQEEFRRSLWQKEYEAFRFENPFEMKLDSTGEAGHFVELPLRG